MCLSYRRRQFSQLTSILWYNWHYFLSNKIHGFKPARDNIKFLRASLCNVSAKILIYLTVSIQDEASIRTTTVEFVFCQQNLLISLRSLRVRIVTQWHTEPSKHSAWFHVLYILMYVRVINWNISKLDSEIYDEKFMWLCYICCQTTRTNLFQLPHEILRRIMSKSVWFIPLGVPPKF